MENSNQKILIVDDTPANIDILNEALSDYSRLVALNGKDAIRLAEKNMPDLILLDIVMPGMDGYQVCDHLKSQELTKDIPIIYITAQTEIESIIKGFESGAVDYVTKPFNITELQARVTTQLALKKSQDDIKNYLGEIESKNSLITESINYAKRIQKAILPDKDYLDEILNEYFIVYCPKDIVSGDFYWIRKISNKVVIVIADCTGHGVPGAFMSMIGTAFLNEIVNRDKTTKPSDILDKLRDMIVKSLNQLSENEVNDGMEVSIITIDREEMKLEFAGSQNKLYYVRDNTLNIIDADNMPVSIYPVMNPFKNNELKLFEGDVIYLSSDGYIDQFGGDSNKKLGRKRLYNLLSEYGVLPLHEQKQKFKSFFIKWKGEFEQVDDVLFFGIKI